MPCAHLKQTDEGLKVNALKGGGDFLGSDTELVYHEGSVTLKPDEVLLFYTDGLIEYRFVPPCR